MSRLATRRCTTKELEAARLGRRHRLLLVINRTAPAAEQLASVNLGHARYTVERTG